VERQTLISKLLAPAAACAIAGAMSVPGPLHARSNQQAVTGQDDRYHFTAGSSEEQTVTLERTTTGVRWTWTRPAATGWHTALLGVRSAGAEYEPWVEIVVGSGRIHHYLDAGATGLRWLNLTSLRGHLADGASVELHGHGVTLEPGPAVLRLFTTRVDLSRPILILAPHPDDAEIAAFGLYAGRNATIVTVTSGNAGDFNYRANVSDPAEHYLLKGYLRAVDSVTVPWQGGIPPERCYNLGYFDARLAVMREKPDEPVAEMYGPNQDVSVYRRANIGRLLPTGARTATWVHLVDDLVEVFRKARPAIIVLPHPLLDTHLDHQFTAVAAVEALERWKEPATFLLYTNHASENRYPFGPAGTVMSLPPWSASYLLVEGVYSHPVDAAMQRRKLFALESMHDLRLSPAEQATCDLGPGLKRRDDYPRVAAVDYFRRAVRSEEVFFVFSREGVREVVRTFLAQPKPSAQTTHNPQLRNSQSR
jgi:LmbE family N-acetylglucosaminyl deacetylase